MAVTAFTNAYFYAGVDISTYCKSVAFDQGADALDSTTFGQTTKINLPGLKSWSFNVQGNADFADDLIDEILAAALGTSLTIKFKPANAAISTGNPEYTGTGVVTGYNISGSVDGLPQFTLTIAAGGELTRDVTP